MRRYGIRAASDLLSAALPPLRGEGRAIVLRDRSRLAVGGFRPLDA